MLAAPQITRLYPRIFSALPLHYLEAVLAFAERGLAMQEQFSLKTTIELLVSPAAPVASQGHASDRHNFFSAVERAANADGVAVRHNIPKRRSAPDPVYLALNTPSDWRRSAPIPPGLSERAAACVPASRAGSGSARAEDTPRRTRIPHGASYGRVESSLRASHIRVSDDLQSSRGVGLSLTAKRHSARTGKQVRQAVTDFALVCRGLDGSAYGAATTVY